MFEPGSAVAKLHAVLRGIPHRVASSEGPGSGAFLARTLADAIDGGGVLAAMRIEPTAGDGSWSIEFQFHFDDHAAWTDELSDVEIVTARLSPTGAVIGADSDRGRATRTDNARRHTADLSRALERSDVVCAIQLVPNPFSGAPEAMRLRSGTGTWHTIELVAFPVT